MSLTSDIQMARDEYYISRLPMCNYCKDTIEDDYYYNIRGVKICLACMRNYIVINKEAKE